MAVRSSGWGCAHGRRTRASGPAPGSTLRLKAPAASVVPVAPQDPTPMATTCTAAPRAHIAAAGCGHGLDRAAVCAQGWRGRAARPRPGKRRRASGLAWQLRSGPSARIPPIRLLDPACARNSRSLTSLYDGTDQGGAFRAFPAHLGPQRGLQAEPSARLPAGLRGRRPRGWPTSRARVLSRPWLCCPVTSTYCAYCAEACAAWQV